jgi:hypothetical protein
VPRDVGAPPYYKYWRAFLGLLQPFQIRRKLAWVRRCNPLHLSNRHLKLSKRKPALNDRYWPITASKRNDSPIIARHDGPYASFCDIAPHDELTSAGGLQPCLPSPGCQRRAPPPRFICGSIAPTIRHVRSLYLIYVRCPGSTRQSTGLGSTHSPPAVLDRCTYAGDCRSARCARSVMQSPGMANEALFQALRIG